ncbi:hypothetical protein ACQKNB_00015 [Lysinibacillus xylanilyticus]|uniref:hypothetical protein n=1 Tax=Lysinibacillus xylanilyticus TaxID=582475 RepID=UPI003D09470D
MLVTKALSQDVTHLAFVPLAEEAARRSAAGSLALRESEASATNVLSVRKRSDSNKCFICAKAKRQQQSEWPVAEISLFELIGCIKMVSQHT